MERLLSLTKTLIVDIFTSPLNLTLLCVCVFLLYKIIRQRNPSNISSSKASPPLPRLKKQDMTLEELKQYNGCNPEGRILIAVNGKVFDVTSRGKDFYGKDGPYAVFAGRDASRGLATFSLDDSCLKDGYDDLSDLSTDEMGRLKEWEMQFKEKYHYVGKLLRPGETPTHYSDIETDADEDNSAGTQQKHGNTTEISAESKKEM